MTFSRKNAKICVSTRGSVWNAQGGFLLSISLGLAVRTFWSDLEKCHNGLREDLVLTFWAEDPLESKIVPEKLVLRQNDFVVGF